jgi:hypothetical protein
MGTDIYLHVERREGHRWQYCGELEDLEIRHYEFFAVLANVQNPVRSTEPFDFITTPRGLPEDMSEELLRDGLLHCGHDPGWVAFRELLDFDWDGKTILRSAVVAPAIAYLFGDGRGKFPKDRLTGAHALAHSGPGPRVTWLDTYRDAVGADFLNKLFDALARFGSPDDVRVIFSFDS